MNCKFFTIACALLSMSFCSWANENKTDSVGYQFTVTKELKTNPVKDQSRSGTCWSFSTLSFIEDDLLRQGKPAVDLSEMFIVRNDYIEKAIKYVRMHGDIAFSAGGSAYDVLYIIDKYGIVPEEVYTGLNYGTDKHQHGTKYYKVKNSWGTEQIYGGFFYASEAFVKYKTMDILVHKDAVPVKILKKLHLK